MIASSGQDFDINVLREIGELKTEVADLKATMREMLGHVDYWAFRDHDRTVWCIFCKNWIASPDDHAPDCLGERARELSGETS